VDASGWLNDTWAEGGAVIDLDRQTLILYGGEDLNSHIPMRRLYLQLLQEVWDGWDVRWANLGILDMADYVGLPRNRVIDGQRSTLQFYVAERRFTAAIGSILLEDHTLRLFPLEGATLHLAVGPALIEAMRDHPGYTHLPLAEWGTGFPLDGFHVDVQERLVEYWTACAAFDPETYIVPFWPGWRVTWLGDNYEVHLARLGDRVSSPTWSTEELLSRVQSAVMSGPVLTIAAAEEMRQ
jgi:hypothetical protein